MTGVQDRQWPAAVSSAHAQYHQTRHPGLLNDQVSLVGFVLPVDTYMVMVA